MAAQPLLGLRPRSAAAQLPAARVALVGIILALLAAASVPVWPTSVARRVAAVGGAAWLTVSGLIGTWSLAESDVALVPGLTVVAIPLALLIIGARQSENTLAPAIARLAGVVGGGTTGPVDPWAATTVAIAGIALLSVRRLRSAVGWLVLPVLLVASVGSIALLADTGVEVVELYTVVPVLALGAAGSWWLIEDRAVRTLAALSPALIVALVPSLVVLASDPQVLGRTLGLTMVAGALAFAGVRGHWLAPTLAGSGAAIGIAVTQLTIVVEVVPRWVTFAVVGALLVWLAATYEAQQARARRLGRYLHALR